MDYLRLLPMLNGAAMGAAACWLRGKGLRAKSAGNAVALARSIHNRVSIEAPAMLRYSDEMGAVCGLPDIAGGYITGCSAKIGIDEVQAGVGAGLFEEVPEAERFKARQSEFGAMVEEIAKGLGIPGVRVESLRFGSKEEMEAYLKSLGEKATAFAGSKDAPRAAPPPPVAAHPSNLESVLAGGGDPAPPTAADVL